MGFWDEWKASEAKRPPDPPRLSPRNQHAAEVLARLPEPVVHRCPCGNEADLLSHCLPCDIADGYLDLETA